MQAYAKKTQQCSQLFLSNDEPRYRVQDLPALGSIQSDWKTLVAIIILIIVVVVVVGILLTGGIVIKGTQKCNLRLEQLRSKVLGPHAGTTPKMLSNSTRLPGEQASKNVPQQKLGLFHWESTA